MSWERDAPSTHRLQNGALRTRSRPRAFGARNRWHTLVGACVFCGAVCARNLISNPDVRIRKSIRSQTIRDWS